MLRFCLLLLCGTIGFGCAAARYQAVPRPVVSVAPGIQHVEEHFDGYEGVHLFAQSWKPATAAKGVVVIVHGLKDHSTRYNDFAQQLVMHGYAVYAFDLRGHGSSEGDRVYIHDFDEYLQDLQIFLARVTAAEPGKPLFLFGHSMGGAIVTLYTITRKPDLKGLILSGPALKPGADINGFLIGISKFLGAVTPTLAVMKLDLNKFSRDPAVVEACREDPLVDQGAGPARTAAKLLGAMQQIQAQMEEVKVPVLVMHGTADMITNPEGSKELSRRAGPMVTLRLYDGLYHDLLHEPEKAEVTSDIITWIEAHTPK